MKLANSLLISALAAAFAASSAFPALTQQSAKPAGDLPDAPQATAAAFVHPNGPTVVMDTSMGRITCQFYQRQTPRAVANFIALAEGSIDWIDPTTGKKQHNKPYYDGTTFHRVIPGFMIQGGDPTGTGMGGPGYRFNDEFDPNLNFDKPGKLAMANSGPNTNGGQFFITEQPYEFGNQHYTLFGQCDEPSVLVVKAITRVPRDGQDRPLTAVVLKKVTIVREDAPMPPLPGQAPPPGAQPKVVNISSGVAQGMLVSKTPPVYPTAARQAGISGTVVLAATIDTDGTVKELHVVSGPDLLQQAALDAVREWRFRPYLLNGHPVEVRTTINIVFSLPR
jgi:peptidyl-prolyl cis-trans isomerase A (cyclophilin A)